MSTQRFLTRLTAGALVLAGLFITTPADALASFARKYGFECSMCHTTVPRVNRFGYNFRKAGFRIPSEIGQVQKMTMDNALAVRLQVLYQYSRSEKFGGPVTAPVSTTDSNNQLYMKEINLFPLTGSWGKYYGSMVEATFAPGEGLELENAYVRFTRGNENSWFTTRIGVMHPYEGYGASDRPFSLAKPMMVSESPNNSGALNNSTGNTFYTLWGFDQAGVEAAYVRGNSTFSSTIFNGTATDGMSAWPAHGGADKKISGQSTKNSKDIQFMFNQILKKDGSGVSAVFYSGHNTLPTGDIVTPEFQNDFNRLAIFGSWMIMPKLGVQAGYQVGKDHYWDTLRLNGGGTFKSTGWFAEVDSPVLDHLTVGARYDVFDPSDLVEHNNKSGYTLFANAPFGDGMQVVGEYQHTSTQRNPASLGAATLPDTTKDGIEVRLIWIW